MPLRTFLVIKANIIHCVSKLSTEAKKVLRSSNEAFCRVHKSNNAGCFLLLATINCRSFGNSFVHKMAHEDFFFVALS